MIHRAFLVVLKGVSYSYAFMGFGIVAPVVLAPKF